MTRALGAATMLVAALAGGCKCSDPKAGQVQWTAPHTALLPETYEIPVLQPPLMYSSIRRLRPWTRGPRAPAGRLEPHVRMPPLYSDWIRDSTHSARLERVLLVFESPVRVPPFPVAGTRATLAARRLRARELADSLTAVRASAYHAQSAAVTALGGTVLEKYWLLQALIADVPVESLALLDSLTGIRYMMQAEPMSRAGTTSVPDTSGMVPVENVIREMNLDKYRVGPCTEVDIALLDTGLKRTHAVLDDPAHVVECYDCWNLNCGGTPDPAHIEDAYKRGHGTCTAAILVGDDDRIPDISRGILDGRLFSYRVYAGDPTQLPDDGCHKPIHPKVALRAFQHAIQELRPILVAEMQVNPEDTGIRPSHCLDVGIVTAQLVSDCADAAFDATIAVLGANGNWTTTLAAPASARRAIGVGMILPDGSTPTAQSRGLTKDGRIKPDVQAMTDARTAGADPAWDPIKHTGTSGSTPFAAGAAALLYCWMSQADAGVLPGNVYAALILCTEWDPAAVSFAGAGPVRLPINGRAWWSEVGMASDAEVVIPLPISPQVRELRAALWWPEYEYPLKTEPRTPVMLEILRPDGSVADESDLAGSFERAQTTVQKPGIWKLRIRTGCVPNGPRVIYWSAAALKR